MKSQHHSRASDIQPTPGSSTPFVELTEEEKIKLETIAPTPPARSPFYAMGSESNASELTMTTTPKNSEEKGEEKESGTPEFLSIFFDLAWT